MREEERPVFIVERSGRATVVTGWRAMLLTAGALLSGLATLVFLAFVFLGVALTIGAVRDVKTTRWSRLGIGAASRPLLQARRPQ